MIISNEILLTLKQLKDYGKATIMTIADYFLQSSYRSLDIKDLNDLLIDLRDSKKLKGKAAKDSFPKINDLEEANARARRLLDKSDSMGIKMISRFDEAFPINLLHTISEEGKEAVPLYLFYRGDLSITTRKAVAVIGTREPSPEGITAGYYIGRAFAEQGFNIVSGLAVGCDSAGHKGALSAHDGVTTAFLAHGLDTVYPPENAKLAEDIVANGGLLMSEYEIGKGVNRYNLVERDRLQAGLADATIVIQTGIHGGTMHAVNATFQSRKPVYAVEYSRPVSPDKEAGNKYLINVKGAKGLKASDVPSLIKDLGASMSSVSGKTSLPVINKEINRELNQNPVPEHELSDVPHDESFPEGTLWNPAF